MLHILDDKTGPIGSFKTYDEVIDFIHKSQIYHLKNIGTNDHPFAGGLGVVDARWLFFYYKHSELAAFYSSLKQPPIREIERKALEQGLDLIEIHYGSDLNSIQLAVTTGLDIESLKKKWCEAYCKEHGCSLVETSHNENSSDTPTTGGDDDLAI